MKRGVMFIRKLLQGIIPTLLLPMMTCGIAEAAPVLAPLQGEISEAHNPKGLTLELSLKEKKNRYQMGELIPLVLHFVNANKQEYSYGSNDGRSRAERFYLTPSTGFVDPLGDWLNSGFAGMFGDSGTGGTVSGESSITEELNLNEWVRFTKPGKYKLQVTSSRLSHKVDPNFLIPREPLILTSNPIEFEVVPTDLKWAAETLRATVQKLDQKIEKRDWDTLKPRIAALQVLRFLDTEAATRELLRRWLKSEPMDQWQCFLGLIGSPHHRLIVKEMEALLEEPEVVVNERFIKLLVCHATFEKHPTPMPVRPEKNEGEAFDHWAKEAEKRRETYRGFHSHYMTRMKAALPNKTEEARRLSMAAFRPRE